MALPPGFTQVGVIPVSPQGRTQTMPSGFSQVGTRQVETPQDIEERSRLSTSRKEAYLEAPEGAFRTILTDEDPVKAAAITTLAQFTPDPYELGNILSRIDPNIGIQVSRDDSGKDKVVAINRATNKIISLNDPGLSMADVGQMTTAMTAAIPAGRLPSMGGRALAEGLIQGGIEATQSAFGGEFNPAEPLMAGGFSVAADAIPMAYQAVRNRNIPARADVPEDQQQAVNQVAEMVRTSGRATEAAPTTQMQQASQLIQPQEETIQAARTLGVTEAGRPLEEVLPMGAVSGNPQYISLESALANAPASSLGVQRQQAIEDVAAKADEFITRFGGDIDQVAVGMEIKDQLIDNVEGLRTQARGLYDAISINVPKETFVDPLPLIDFLEKKAKELGGMSRLSPNEQKLYKAAKSEDIPFTYGYLDQQRKLIGEMQRSQPGTYPGEKKFELGELELALLDSQRASLARINPEAAKDFDIVRPLVAQRKELESINQMLMGKDLAGDIMPKITGALPQLSRGKIQKFVETMDALPPEMQAQAVVSAMNSAFTSGARSQSQLSAGGFSSWWDKLSRNKTAKETLLKYMPEGAAEYLEALATVSKGLDRSLKAVPPTGVTKALGMLDSDQGFIQQMLPMIPMVGSPLASVLKSADTDTLGAATDLMVDPVFKRLVFRGAQGQETTRLMDQLATKPVFKQWMQTLPEQTSARILSVGLANYLFGEDGQ